MSDRLRDPTHGGQREAAGQFGFTAVEAAFLQILGAAFRQIPEGGQRFAGVLRVSVGGPWHEGGSLYRVDG